MSKKIRWTPTELDALATSYVKCRKEGHARMFCIEQSQKVLPPHRRRDIKSISQMPSFWHQLVDTYSKDKVEPTETSSAQTPPTNAELLTKLVDELMDKFVDIMFEKLQAKLQGLNLQTEPVVKHNPNGVATPRAVKCKIVIVGMLKDQLDHLVREFPHFDIIGIEKTCPSKLIADRVKGANYVLAMTTHMGHQLESSITNCTKSRNIEYIRIHGSITKFREVLKTLPN